MLTSSTHRPAGSAHHAHIIIASGTSAAGRRGFYARCLYDGYSDRIAFRKSAFYLDIAFIVDSKRYLHQAVACRGPFRARQGDWPEDVLETLDFDELDFEELPDFVELLFVLVPLPDATVPPVAVLDACADVSVDPADEAVLLPLFFTKT